MTKTVNRTTLFFCGRANEMRFNLPPFINQHPFGARQWQRLKLIVGRVASWQNALQSTLFY